MVGMQYFVILVRVMNVMWGRGLHELLPLNVSHLKLTYDGDMPYLVPLPAFYSFNHSDVFIQRTVPVLNLLHSHWMCLTASIFPTLSSCSSFIFWLFFCQQMVLQSLRTASPVELDNICSPGPPQKMQCPLLKGKREAGLVPELRQMFVEISEDFLVFFMQGKKEKRAKFL